VWDYWIGHEPYELMAHSGSNRLLRDVAAVYLRDPAWLLAPRIYRPSRGYACVVRVDHPDPVFLLDAPWAVPPGGSFRIADGVGRMTALATVALGAGLAPTPVAIIAEN
jgi:hypothetical protein